MTTQKRSATGAGLTIGFAALGLAVVTAIPAAAQRTQSYEVSGQEVSIYNVAGEITVRAGGGSAVVVELTSGGADAGELSVETGSIDEQWLPHRDPNSR
jgi:hypothetical protein